MVLVLGQEVGVGMTILNCIVQLEHLKKYTFHTSKICRPSSGERAKHNRQLAVKEELRCFIIAANLLLLVRSGTAPPARVVSSGDFKIKCCGSDLGPFNSSVEHEDDFCQ